MSLQAAVPSRAGDSAPPVWTDASGIPAWFVRHGIDPSKVTARPRPRPLLPQPDPAARVIAGRSARHIHAVGLSRLLVTGTVERDRTPFLLPDAARAAAASILTPVASRELFDAAKVSLRGVGDDHVVVGPSSYLDGVVTNACGATVWEGAGFVWDAAAGAVNADGRLLPIGCTQGLSNHLGGTVLAITADGRVLLTTQPSSSAVSAGQTVPTATGSFDLEDLAELGTSPKRVRFIDLACRALGRELHEEAGIEPVFARFVPLGVTRDLLRAGKPECHLLALLPKGTRFGAGDRSGAETVTVELDDAAQVVATLHGLAARDDVSGSLLAAATLAAVRIGADPTLLNRFER